MAKLSDIKKVKLESTQPVNSNEVVKNVRAKIRSINTVEKEVYNPETQETEDVTKLFINLETESGLHFPDVITFKDGKIDSTIKYLSVHAGHIFKQLGDEYNSFTDSYDAVMTKLEKVKAKAKYFKMSTVESEYEGPNGEKYVDVLYGDEKPQNA